MKSTWKTTWNLELLYKGTNDPAIEKDMKAYEKACASFEKKYKNDTQYLKNENKLLEALTEYEKMFSMPGSGKAISYFYYRKDLQATDQDAESMMNKLSQRLTLAANKILFFELALGKVAKEVQDKFLKSKKLAHYNYFLKIIFQASKYMLTEPEEKILNIKSLPAHGMWVQGQEKILSQQVVSFKGTELPLPQAANMLTELPTDDRRMLGDEINKTLKSISYFAESEINAVYTDKKISDELRGFKKPYSGTVLHYQNSEKSVENLVETITRRFDISHKFYKVKSKLLKLSNFHYADRAAKAGKISIKLTFDECVGIIEKAFGSANPKYVEIFRSYLENGQIDVYPKQGKRGGAYCSSSIGLPTYVFLNHVDTFDSLKTLAHEMGHAIHAEFSKSQSPAYQGHTISVAEVASTLFENFAFDEVFPKLSKEEQIVALHDRINDSISTVFRQIACFNFELELHQVIRAAGSISKEQIAELHNKHMKAYLGPLFEMKELDGYFFVQWSHIRRFFYVYSYAYGELISKALYKKYKEDKNFISKIETFLSAGASKSPEDIFKSIGLDTSKPGFFEAGLAQIEDDIKKLDKLI